MTLLTSILCTVGASCLITVIFQVYYRKKDIQERKKTIDNIDNHIENIK